MAVVLAASGWVLYAGIGSHLSLALDRSLRLRAQDLAQLVSETDTPLAGASGAPFVEEGEVYAQLLDTRGHVRDSTRLVAAGSLLSPDELRRALQAPLLANRSSVPGLDEPSRLLATRVERNGSPLVLVVGATREDRAETLRRLRTELLIAGPIALALATLAGYLLAGFSLRPVESMRRRAAAISAETPGERLPVPRSGDELQRLGETLNEMLARLEAALDRERDFVADAGHELRTPLALLRTELELAVRHSESPDELRLAVSRSTAEVDRLAQLAEDLLLIASSERGKLQLHLRALDTSELLASVATRFEWRAQEAHRPLVAIPSDGLTVLGDRIRLEQALANLVDNALRHGAGAVRLEAVTADGHVELHVIDEGAGFPPEFLDRAFERFARPDEARTGGGSGLGLSIVRVVAEAHGGDARVANRAGGADAWITLPEAQANTVPREPGSAAS
jgi:signal transduction histidine kinase